MKAEELGQTLHQKTNLTPTQIKQQTKEIIQEYKPLITDKTSAVILLGKQHDIDLIETQAPQLKIENIVPEMNNVNIQAKIKNIDKFTYTKNGEQKKGCDITLSDDTGKISMMVWGKQVNKIDKNLEGEKIKVKNSYSSKYKGETQLNYGKETKIEKM